MKNGILILLILMTSQLFAQTITYEEFEATENKKKVKLDAYQSKNGQVFKIGDKITIGDPSMRNDQYLSVVRNDLGTLKRINVGMKGFEAEIKKFRIYGKKRIGYYVVAVTKTPDGLSNLWIEIEAAIKDGEILTSGLNREQAIAKLKETKELLELELISKQEYEKIKKELTPIIINKE